MRGVVIATLIGALLAVAWFGFSRHASASFDQSDIATLIYALLTLLLFGGAAVSASRRSAATGARGLGPVTSLLIWAALIAGAAVLYRGGEFWAALASLFR